MTYSVNAIRGLRILLMGLFWIGVIAVSIVAATTEKPKFFLFAEAQLNTELTSCFVMLMFALKFGLSNSTPGGTFGTLTPTE